MLDFYQVVNETLPGHELSRVESIRELKLHNLQPFDVYFFSLMLSNMDIVFYHRILTNDVVGKIERERFSVVGSHCCRNLKFVLSFFRVVVLQNPSRK